MRNKIREKQGAEFEATFKNWKKDKELLQSHPTTSLKIGDIVDYTNSNGVVIHGLKVMGFVNHEILTNNHFYLNMDCYWVPVKAESLKMVLCHICGQPAHAICDICDKYFCQECSESYDKSREMCRDCFKKINEPLIEVL
ncbi:MAG: hypothetical protein LBT24_01555 [Tannerella sp.]|jgi:hypothetical protein|nr:hypothetical protein [Tannerella sp.]